MVGECRENHAATVGLPYDVSFTLPPDADDNPLCAYLIPPNFEVTTSATHAQAAGSASSSLPRDFVQDVLSLSPLPCLKKLFVVFGIIWQRIQQVQVTCSREQLRSLAHSTAQLLYFLDRAYRFELSPEASSVPLDDLQRSVFLASGLTLSLPYTLRAGCWMRSPSSSRRKELVIFSASCCTKQRG